MSPEHAYPISRPDHHCDLWAAATVAYEALTGDLPVPGFSTDELLENLRVRRFVPVLQRTPHLPKALEGFFERAFAERIEDRHANAADLATAFAQAAGIPTESARTGEERGPVPKIALRSIAAAPPRRTKVFIGAAAIAVVASVVGAGLALAKHAAPSTTAPAPVAQQASVVDSRGSPTPKLTSTFVQAEQNEGGERPADAWRATASAQKERRAEVFPSITAPESASTARPGCSPPYEFDAHGYKRWKRECF
jgi:hypothetical protein